MSITKILSDETSSSEEKLIAVADIIASARKAYCNEEEEIAVPRVETAHGSMPFDMLEDDGKVSILRDQVVALKAKAVELCEQTQGTNVNKKIEELLATNVFFVNVDSGVKFKYL